jgi:hypothetical protein
MWALAALGALALSLEPRNHHAFLVCPPLALWVAPALALRPWAARYADLAKALVRPARPARPARVARRPQGSQKPGDLQP